MHGGAKSFGAPRDNLNALTHGLYTTEAPARRRLVNRLLLQTENRSDRPARLSPPQP